MNVFHHRPTPTVHRPGIDEGGKQGLRRAGAEHHFLHDAAQLFAGEPPPFPRLAPDRHGQGGGGLDRQRDLGEKMFRVASRQPAKVGAGRAIQAYRNHGCPGLGGDKGRAVVHLHQGAGDGDSALGENYHRAARFHEAQNLFHRHRTGGVHRQIVGQGQDQFEKGLLGNGGVDDKYRVDRQKQTQQQPVQKRFMIGDDQ